VNKSLRFRCCVRQVSGDWRLRSECLASEPRAHVLELFSSFFLCQRKLYWYVHRVRTEYENRCNIPNVEEFKVPHQPT
jgi:hypothetical protein